MALIQAVEALAIKALQNGGSRKGLRSVEWDISARCQNPKRVEVLGSVLRKGICPSDNTQDSITVVKGNERMFVSLDVRCRKCDACRAYRRALWANRARAETRMAFRTWFGTLTLSPERQHFMRVSATHRLKKSGVNFDHLDNVERFQEICREISPEITRWLKRVRKQSGAKLRYLLVVEAHASGLPHFHLLVHEVTLASVTYRVLHDQWHFGFSSWKLINPQDDRSHWYVTKYLAKSALARIRASARYGAPRRFLGLGEAPDKSEVERAVA